jgi:hypothetical protein
MATVVTRFRVTGRVSAALGRLGVGLNVGVGHPRPYAAEERLGGINGCVLALTDASEHLGRVRQGVRLETGTKSAGVHIINALDRFLK